MTTLTKPGSALPKQQEDEITLPYLPSWADRVLAWIERLPIPGWLFYLLVLILALLLEHIVRWMEGSLPPFTISFALVAEAPYLLFAPAAQQYLNATARRALQEFRLALQIDDTEYKILEYKLTTVPARAGWIVGVLGAALAMLSIFSTPAAFGISDRTSTATTSILVLYLVIQAPFYTVLIYHTVHQLRLVTQIHRMVKQINLFQLFPVYAFSALTARTGLAMLLLAYYTFFFFYHLNLRGTTPGIVGGASLFLYVLVALACFVLPLNGIHLRLAQEKSRLLAESKRRTESTLVALHQQVDTGEYGNVDGPQKALAALKAEHELLEKISTWPWKTETLRSFISAMTLPIILYLISRFLGRLVGL